MPKEWVIPGTSRAAVMIGGNDDKFFKRVDKSLNKINGTVSGHALLNDLATRRNRAMKEDCLFVTIQSSDRNNQCAGIARVNTGGNSAYCRTLLAQALIDGVGSILVEIQACLTAMEHPGTAGHAWLADAVNTTPLYNILGMPELRPQNVIRLTADDVTEWINGRTVFPAPVPAAQLNDLKLLLLTALWPGSSARPGTGIHSKVSWNPDKKGVTLTTGVALIGSKSVSLAHELTHALYNAQGRQLGIDEGSFSTVLCEYMCVGLGPWANEPCTENKYRAQWKRPKLGPRPSY